jgi:hypothetical protein
VARDEIEHEPFAQRQVAQRDLLGAEPAQRFVEQDRPRDGEVGAPCSGRGRAGVVEMQRDEILQMRRICFAATRRLRSGVPGASVRRGGDRPRLRIVPDVPITRSKPARLICCRYCRSRCE